MLSHGSKKYVTIVTFQEQRRVIWVSPLASGLPGRETLGIPVTEFANAHDAISVLRTGATRGIDACCSTGFATRNRLPPTAGGDAERLQKCLLARRARKTLFTVPPAVPAIRPATCR